MSDTTQITTVRVDAGGLPINCLAAGDRSAETVLLLHGGGLTGYTWAPLVRRLASSYRCVMPELRGHGDSGWASDGRYTLRGYADDIAALLATLRLDPCLIAGMSLGGQVAMQLVADGHQARALALVDVGPTTEPRAEEEIRSFLRVNRFDSFEHALAAARRFNPQRSIRNLRTTLVRNMVQQPDGSWRFKWDPRRFDSFEERRAEAERLWQRLGEISCPVLVVRGADSEVFPAALASRTAAAFASARLVTIPKAGHTVQGDNPDALAQALEQFIDGIRDEVVQTR